MIDFVNIIDCKPHATNLFYSSLSHESCPIDACVRITVLLLLLAYQGDFEDTYQNLAYKSSYAIQWAVEHISADYYAAGDDDVVLDTGKIITILRNSSTLMPTGNFMVGRVAVGAATIVDRYNKDGVGDNGCKWVSEYFLMSCLSATQIHRRTHSAFMMMTFPSVAYGHDTCTECFSV